MSRRNSWVRLPIFFVYVFSMSFAAVTFADESCECPKLACDACSIERGVTFFSAKCGPNDGKVKSCARPTCLPLEETTKECPVLPTAAGPREPIVVAKPSGSMDDKLVAVGLKVGVVKVLQGSVTVTRADGQKVPATEGMDLRENEVVESSGEAGTVVQLEGGNKIHVHPETAVKVNEHREVSSPTNRRTLIELVRGKIRNQVGQKYNGKTSLYEVKVKAVVAGVRGTDFIVESREATAEGGKAEVNVEAISGKVALRSEQSKETREILRGEAVKYTFDAAMPTGGSMSPVFKIPEDEFRDLERMSRLDLLARNQKVKPKLEQPICSSPKAFFNQCVWRCVGADGKASAAGATDGKCPLNVAGVRCLRSRCNGNGEWSEEQEIKGSAAGVSCTQAKDTVKPCDY